MNEKCECRINQTKLKGGAVGLSIHYCPKHAAVDEMVRLLKEITVNLKIPPKDAGCSVFNTFWDDLAGNISLPLLRQCKALLDKIGGVE